MGLFASDRRSPAPPSLAERSSPALLSTPDVVAALDMDCVQAHRSLQKTPRHFSFVTRSKSAENAPIFFPQKIPPGIFSIVSHKCNTQASRSL